MGAEIVIDLGGIDRQRPPTLGGQRSLYGLSAEPGEPVPALDHDPRHRWSAQPGQEPGLSFRSGPISVTT